MIIAGIAECYSDVGRLTEFKDRVSWGDLFLEPPSQFEQDSISSLSHHSIESFEQ